MNSRAKCTAFLSQPRRGVADAAPSTRLLKVTLVLGLASLVSLAPRSRVRRRPAPGLERWRWRARSSSRCSRSRCRAGSCRSYTGVARRQRRRSLTPLLEPRRRSAAAHLDPARRRRTGAHRLSVPAPRASSSGSGVEARCRSVSLTTVRSQSGPSASSLCSAVWRSGSSRCSGCRAGPCVSSTRRGCGWPSSSRRARHHAAAEISRERARHDADGVRASSRRRC